MNKRKQNITKAKEQRGEINTEQKEILAHYSKNSNFKNETFFRNEQ